MTTSSHGRFVSVGEHAKNRLIAKVAAVLILPD
jgi:hypothetical protein